MAAEETPIDRRDELKVVDEALASTRQTAAELRQRIGDRADAPTDPEEVAVLITAAEEQEAVIAALEAKRERIAQPDRGGHPE
jgi:hypothetical protein